MTDADNILKIDKTRLPEEWCLQAERYHEAALDLAEASAELDAAEDTLKLVEAQEDLKIRRDPEQPAKTTETAIKNMVVLSKPYQAAKRRIREASDNVNKLKALVIALDHKKKALESLVQLDGREFFAEPRARGDRRAEFEDQARRNTLRRGS